MNKLIEKWQPVDDPKSRYKVTVWCPDCGLRIGIVGHEIDGQGNLSPSLVCPHEGCSFHEYVQLKDYPKMTKRLKTKFVEFMPETMEDGIIYVSQEFELAIHLCACGCGKETVTPFFGDGWKITIEDDFITLLPSIGNWQFPCRSHYWIRKNEVIWA